MAKKTPAADAKKPVAKPAAPTSTLSKAKKVVVGAAEKVVGVVADVAEAAQERVVTPVAEAVGIVEEKKPRAVRVKQAPAAKAAPLPARSKGAAGKMMSKNVPSSHKEQSPPESKSKTKSKTKPKL